MDKIKFVYRFQAGRVTCQKTFVPDGDKVQIVEAVSGKQTMAVWVPVIAAREILRAALKAGWTQVFPAPVAVGVKSSEATTATNDVMTAPWHVLLQEAVNAYKGGHPSCAQDLMEQAQEAATGQPEALQACQDIESTWDIPAGDDDDEPEECRSCAGTGELYDRRCSSCDGKGYICRESDDDCDGPDDDYDPDYECDINDF